MALLQGPRQRLTYSKARSIFLQKRRQYLLAPNAGPDGFPCPAASGWPLGSSLEERSLDRSGSTTAPVVIGTGLVGLSASALGTQSPPELKASPTGHCLHTNPLVLGRSASKTSSGCSTGRRAFTRDRNFWAADRLGDDHTPLIASL